MDTQSGAITPAHPLPLPVPLRLLSDERLARLVGAGHERAFAALYERYHQPLYRYCRSILRHDADAQDALQSALAGAFAALKREQRDAPLRPWLYRIAHNEAVSVLRRRRADAELSELAEATGGSVEERMEERARLSQLVADMNELPERQRAALLMRELSGLSHEEISAALETSVGSAKQTIFEARRSLLEFAEGRAMQCEAIRRSVSDGDGRALRGRRVRAHIRECASCAAFAGGISERRADLHALAPPLPAIAATGLLGRLLGGGSGHGGGTGGLAAGAASKGVGSALLMKAVGGAAVLATVAAGATVTIKHLNHTVRQASPAPTVLAPAARAAAGVVSAGDARSIARSTGTTAGGATSRHGRARAASATTGRGRAHGATTVRAVTLAAAGRNNLIGALKSGVAKSVTGSSHASSRGGGNTTSAAHSGGSGSAAHAHHAGSSGGGKPATAGMGKPSATAPPEVDRPTLRPA